MIDLNNVVNSTSGLTLRAASAIKQHQQIAGWATNSIGSEFGILLTPVPQPSTVATLLASAACLLSYAWRRR